MDLDMLNKSITVETEPVAGWGRPDMMDHDGFHDDNLELASIIATGKRTSFAPHDVIYREGDDVETVSLVCRGLVKLLSYLPNGRARIIRLHGRNAWIGLEGLLRQPYAHTAVAVDKVEVCRIPVQNLYRLRSENPQLYCRFMENWYEHLCDADVWIAQFSTGSIKSRVARLINFLSQLENGEAEASGAVRLLTCEEMAAILGVTTESVSRTMAAFKRGRLLHSAHGHPREHWYERDVQALQAAAQDI